MPSSLSGGSGPSLAFLGVEQHPSVPASAIRRPSPWVSVTNLPSPYKDTSCNGLRTFLMQNGLILT